jgi:hypothetical protein
MKIGPEVPKKRNFTSSLVYGGGFHPFTLT